MMLRNIFIRPEHCVPTTSLLSMGYVSPFVFIANPNLILLRLPSSLRMLLWHIKVITISVFQPDNSYAKYHITLFVANLIAVCLQTTCQSRSYSATKSCYIRSRWKCMKLGLRDSTESRTVLSIHDGYMKVKLLGVRNDGFFDFRRVISTFSAASQAYIGSPACGSDQGGVVACEDAESLKMWRNLFWWMMLRCVVGIKNIRKASRIGCC